MVLTGSRVQVHIADPVPGVIVARVLDGLRALGLHAELLGGTPPRARAGSRVVLAWQGGTPAGADDDATVRVPARLAPGGVDRALADRVLASVVARLERA